MGTMEFVFTQTSYQTAPLEDYTVELRERAAALFRLVADRAGASRARQFKGSFSVFAASSDATAAKIVIYEAGKGKMNGHDPGLADGIYVLIPGVRGHRAHYWGGAHAPREVCLL